MFKKIKEYVLDNWLPLTIISYIAVMFAMSIICEPVGCVMAMIGLAVLFIFAALGFLLM